MSEFFNKIKYNVTAKKYIISTAVDVTIFANGRNVILKKWFAKFNKVRFHTRQQRHALDNWPQEPLHWIYGHTLIRCW